MCCGDKDNEHCCVVCGRPPPNVDVVAYEAQYDGHSSMIIGTVLIIFGYCVVIVSSVHNNLAATHEQFVDHSCLTTALISGILAVLAGWIGIMAGSYRSKCAIIVFLVFSVAALVFSLISIIVRIDEVSRISNWWEHHEERRKEESNDDNFYSIDYGSTLAMLVILIVLTLILIILLAFCLQLTVSVIIINSTSVIRLPPDPVYTLHPLCVAIIFFVVFLLIAIYSIVIFIFIYVKDYQKDTDLPVGFLLFGAILLIIFAGSATSNYRSAKQMSIVFLVSTCCCCAITTFMMCVCAAVFVAFLGHTKERFRRADNSSLSTLLLVEAIICLIATILAILSTAYAGYVLAQKTPMADNGDQAHDAHVSPTPSPEDGRKSNDEGRSSIDDATTQDGRNSTQEGRKSHLSTMEGDQEGRPSTIKSQEEPVVESASQQALIDSTPMPDA